MNKQIALRSLTGYQTNEDLTKALNEVIRRVNGLATLIELDHEKQLQLNEIINKANEIYGFDNKEVGND